MSIKYTTLSGRLVMIGFGSIGQGVLPLILRHINISPDQVTIFTAHDKGRDVAAALGVTDFRLQPLTRENYRDHLDPLVTKGAFVLNLAYDVASTALIELCHETGALYLDSCIEPWAGGYYDPNLTPTERSNYGLREQALDINRRNWPNRPTCVVTHGVNPGLVSHFVKEALLNMAQANGLPADKPTTREEWAELSMQLGIKTIHIAERDTQVPAIAKKPGEFVNTWSVEAFVGEGSQPAELGWGSHEKAMPQDGRRHPIGSQAAIYLERPGVAARVRSWTPLEGPYHGFLITHGESISIADYLTVRQSNGAGDNVMYRPTVHYAYHPCDAAVMSVHEYCGKGYVLQDNHRLIKDEIASGMDELGVLLCGNDKGVYWYGSRLTINRPAACARITALPACRPLLVFWAA